MSQHHTDDALRMLSAELAQASPTASFGAGVRVRVSEHSLARRKAWAWAGAAALFVTGVLVVAVTTPGWARLDSTKATFHVPRPTPVGAAAPELPSAAAEAATAAPAVRRVPRSTVRAGALDAVAIAAPDLSVQTNQPELLQRLWSRHSLTTHETPAMPPSPVAQGLLPLEVPLLTVDLIRVTPLTDEGTGGTSATIRRFTADPSTRSN